MVIIKKIYPYHCKKEKKIRTLGLDIMVGLEKDKYMDTLLLGQSNWTLFKIVIV